ncbi:hypothetical protein P280DRAFT_465883 [Massarina eburnea CBS 473.64]|uniref:Uncharacterized protein n=1 Tax=Massarina eburnea CBS 473.64 TaxID=1395130 RepID=A0A6A6SCL4_9PLEO|nr:hypothetical protein P280DRAFT_465883 [Massarina eburnea CBS 473.64]
MSFLRPSTMLRLRPAIPTAPRTCMKLRYSTQDYGSGDGNPAGENPQAQGRGREDLEHPGPPPPKVAQKGSSSSPKTSGKSDAASQKSSGKDKGESAKGKPEPKILNENPPSKENESKDVRSHNEEMDNRAERAHEQVSNEDAKNDKVPSKFWSGQGGRDNDP